jgi:signal transduction histidine kinase
MSLLVCWFIVGCLGVLAISVLAQHRPTLRAYVNSFAGALALSFVYELWITHSGGLGNDALLLTMLLYWFFLMYVGRKQHRVFLQAMTLQHRNALLIESLNARTGVLQESLDARRRFLAVATHDLRQPVHALRLYAEMLSQDLAQVDELSQRIVKSSTAVNSMFENLFDLARLDWNLMRPSREPVRLAEVMADMEVQARPQALDKGLELRMRISRRLREASVLTDRVMLQRMVGNLLANALKYTDRGGVLLALRGTPERPRLEVWDTGIGIAAHEQPLVAQEFFKSETRLGTHEGFGLGLTIVQQLALQLNCTVSLRSCEGRGSMFRVELPEQGEQSA